MEENEQSPLFTKTTDFLFWLLNHTEKFPKSERFRLAKRLEDSAFAFYERLIEATRTTRRKKQVLYQADLELEKLRLFMRLSQRRNLTKLAQYRFAAEQLTEMGNLLGGWLKSLPGEN